MRVLVIGSGGREHALVWKLAQSNLCEKVFVAPGNAGTADEPKTENVDLSAEDLDGLLDFAKSNSPSKSSALRSTFSVFGSSAVPAFPGATKTFSHKLL